MSTKPMARFSLSLSVTLFLSAAFTLAGIGSQALAQDSAVINIDETVTGNQEQPKVLYIVPWKTAADSFDFEQSLSQKTTNSVFKHLERDELKRQLDYLQARTVNESKD